MKKVSIAIMSICLMGSLSTSAQFGKLLDKVKGNKDKE